MEAAYRAAAPAELVARLDQDWAELPGPAEPGDDGPLDRAGLPRRSRGKGSWSGDAGLGRPAGSVATVRPGRPVDEERVADEHVAGPSGGERRGTASVPVEPAGETWEKLAPSRSVGLEDRWDVKVRADMEQLGRGVVGADVVEQDRHEQPTLPS